MTPRFADNSGPARARLAAFRCSRTTTNDGKGVEKESEKLNDYK